MTDLYRLEELAKNAAPGATWNTFIAACDPQTILSLIERLRAAEQRLLDFDEAAELDTGAR